MKFSELLLLAIRKSEIPLRFEPGAEEAVARPVTEMLKAWIELHQPPRSNSEFDDGQCALIRRLKEELDDSCEVPLEQ